ncbi:MAG: HAD family hydrolase [Dehalococcoidia bacterium]
MKEVELVSFDAEGTLVTHDFSAALWHEAIPALYAQRTGLDPARARESVFEEYDSVGQHRMEWYDIQYWVSRLDLGSADQVIRECVSRIRYYPEVMQVLRSLGKRYRLIVASCTPQEFLRFLLHEIEPQFVRVFSSVSDYRQLKNPDFYLSICEELGVQPAQAVHVGDNWQMDFLNSREAGLHALYLDRSGNGNNESIADLTQLETFLMR